jgi:hypothetical protein
MRVKECYRRVRASGGSFHIFESSRTVLTVMPYQTGFFGGAPMASYPLFRVLRHFLEQHCSDPEFTTAVAAASAGISRMRFASVFRKRFAATPSDYRGKKSLARQPTCRKPSNM